MQYDVIIIGAGAAGLVAAARAAELGKRTLLLEKSNKVGVKILISGGTRCNVTHSTDDRGIATAFGSQGKFLRSALAALKPPDVVAMVEGEGVATKREDTGKIFPASDRAIDVRDAFLKRAIDRGVELVTGCAVKSVRKLQDEFIVSDGTKEFAASSLLITTGGKSYPGCGTTGDGYAWASDFGHSIVDPVPALTPIMTNVDWPRDLKGITLPDAVVSVVKHNAEKAASGFGKKEILASRRSSLLFAHFGMSGPAALDVSRVVSRDENPNSLSALCDFFPEGNLEEFYSRLTSDLNGAARKQISSLMLDYVPRRLADALLSEANVSPETRAAELSKKQTRRLAMGIKHSVIPLSGTLGFRKAEVTAGGVSLREVDSRTMQSKMVDGLFFAGEILDVDGPIGGYNFQAAFSTGHLAGSNV